MSDKELLELAAQAYWKQEIADEEVSLRYDESEGEILYFHADNQDHNGCDREFAWNPLIDDGQALRLAVKLEFQLRLRHSENMVSVYGSPDGRLDESVMGDPCAATRRAIVRAAASMISIP